MANIVEILPACRADVRESITLPMEKARISYIKQPFHMQPNVCKNSNLYGKSVSLYDGFELQHIFGQAIPEKEKTLDHIHVIFTDMFACTFSEDDWRYHARTVICGTPSIVSAPGIVEAPAKPREFYFSLSLGMDPDAAKKRVQDRFIEYGDARTQDAATNFALQAVFFFLTEGEPFCVDPACRMFNAHWQEDLIKNLKKPRLCDGHRQIADKFNRRLARM